ncbi:probable cytochrome P450 6a14 [Homalodisca vitripennis]|uniref:probable cytochrome P450 6a14 n=1 Tax=Homalodisca vitripennis TaxID=197043 RepID=UPI001EECAB3E|nr:probable cytochrome P450 6a14 [Homalodisca vitripennis]
MFVEFLVGLSAILVSLYLYFIHNYDYWKKKVVIFIKPKFPLGNFHDQFFGKADIGNIIERDYTVYKKKGLKYVGSFSLREPNLMLIDLDLCKHVLSKDFNHFVSRDFTVTTHEYLSKHLFALDGQEWKDMRVKLTPTFTSGKMKNMFQLMGKCADQLQDHIDRVILHKGKFEVKDLIARFTTDIIATCAFGLEVNSIENRDDEFYRLSQVIFVPTRSFFLKAIIHRAFPTIAKAIKLDIFHPRLSALLRIMKSTIEYRRTNNVTRNDFIDLLMKVKENKSLVDDEDQIVNESDRSGCQNHGKELLTLEEMTAQAFVFLAAGFETAASTTSFCLYELAKSPTVQERLRQEIDEVLANYDNKITYQALQDMTYMDQVINETLRMYASLPFLTRVCTERYQFPGTDLVIEKGVRVNIPTYAIHHDPDIYPDPYKFDPDRFSEENSKDRHHYAFLPFGEGPRICIGMRFGKLQVKVGLAAILSKYQLSPAPDTPSKMELNPLIAVTTPKHPFSLRITRRPDKL